MATMRSLALAMANAFSIPSADSRIGISQIGRSSLQRARDLGDSLFHRQHLLRVLDLGDEHQVGRFRDDLFQILVAERELVDAHHALGGAEIHRAQGVADQNAGRVLLRGMDRVFEVEDDGVGRVQSGVDEILGFAAGKVEPRAAQSVASRRRRQRD